MVSWLLTPGGSIQLAFLAALARYLPVFFWSISLLFGFIQAWLGRFAMAQDGIQYLDLGDSLQRGFVKGISTYWGLLYPWLAGMVMSVVHPSARWEFPLIHAINFVLFVAALGAFQFLLSTLRKFPPPAFKQDPLRAQVADCALMGIAYSVFLYTTLDFSGLDWVTPDILVAVFTYLAAAFVLRIQRDPDRLSNYCALGLTMGVGYLAKSVFLPLTAVLVLLVATMIRRDVGGVLRLAVVAAIVLMFAGPYIVLMSRAKSAFTIGDSAKLNMIWAVNRVRLTNAQGSPTGHGAAIHPTRQLSDRPEIFEFGSPVGGTYPPWFNPAYWYDGIGVRFAPKEFLASLIHNLKAYQYWIHHRQMIIIGGLLILILLIPPRHLGTELIGNWRFLALAAFPLAMYAPITVESRYLQPSFAMLWTGLFVVALRASREIPIRVISAVATVVTLLVTLEAALAIKPASGVEMSLQIAEEMSALGVAPGDPVAIVGDESYSWARLARVHVVSEVFFNQDAWSPETRKLREQEWNKAREILPATGAKFLVSSALPGIVDQENWIPLANTGFFAYNLSRP